MPIKEPDVWALIWSWLQINLSSSSIQSALWALFISILRLGFMRKNQVSDMCSLMQLCVHLLLA